MESTNFERWLAGIFGQSEEQVGQLLKDPTAVQFLITWSIFETRLFERFMTRDKIRLFAEQRVNEQFDQSSIHEDAKYFHHRYSQHPTFYKNLLDQDKPKCKELPEVDAILKSTFEMLDETQVLVLSTFVVYRFRNNIFHGNKGVTSWLQFKEQIDRCTNIMQRLISHVETNQQPA